MIWSKKRFEVLKRDWFRCTYCWRNWKDVTLEVDHIIPKKEWWDDSLSNLTTCCRECNIWKWVDIIDKPSKNIWKQKIDDCIYKSKTYLYNSWNNNFMWSIDKKTTVLISIYISNYIKWSDWLWYISYLSYPPLYWKWSKWWDNRLSVDMKKMDKLFKQW